MTVVPQSYIPRELTTRPRVLVIDDSKPTAKALAVLLDGASYETTIALRGADGLARASESRPGTFAAALVDVHLPDISGLVVSQKLREMLGSDIPIIVLSGDTSMATPKSLSDAGATHFFSKPVNSNQLLEFLRECAPPGKPPTD